MNHHGQDARAALAAQLRSDREFGLDAVPRVAAPPARAAEPRPAAAAAAPRERVEPAAALRVPALRQLLGSAEKRRALDALDAEVHACTACKLARTRTLAVPGEGSVDADLMFIGEGPGADEDASGRPFVGRAGELLTKIILAMGFSRETVFIANIVKCRPPDNRVPEQDEIRSCSPFLDRQIELVRPRVLCTLGLPATRTLLQTSSGISALRGRPFLYKGTPLVPTFHPAYLLRSPGEKPKVWQDVQMIARLVVERGGSIPHPEVLARSTGA